MMAMQGGFDPDTPIGSFVEGGYFTGIVQDNGLSFAIILAPKATGENAGVQYKDANTAAPTETQTLTNGPAATAAMVAAGSSSVYPAAHWADGLSINGYDDWYLPARDELELVWRNLKPVTNGNFIGTRGKSGSTAYTNDGNTDDVVGDGHGLNRHSVPSRSGYSSGTPARTTEALFQAGGDEAMEFGGTTRYWTSTEFEATSAWTHVYHVTNPGAQGSFTKITHYRARAVRRVRAAA